MTRTALGHAEYQEFAFPCNGCGVEIRYGMDLDQKKADWAYTKLINAEWIKSEKEPDEIDVRVFDTETLIPLDIGTFFSPFIRTAHLPRDAKRYHRDRTCRIKLCQEVWPVLRKLKIHFENRNWKLYQKEWQLIDPDFNESRELWLVAHFFRQLHRFGELFRPFSEADSQLLRQRINLAESISPKACSQLREYFDGLGWSEHLFSELYSIKDRWVNIYGIVQPIYLSLYWDERKNSLDDFAVSQKRFDELKPLFVDIYETLCRVSVIAGAFEGIIFSGNPVIPNEAREITVDEYRGTDNGKKFELFQRLVPARCFTQMSESTMRNGIGHHSAHYEVKNDVIRYRKENKKGIKSFEISYTRFCDALVRLYGQFDVASVYVNWLLARKAGLTGKVV